MNGWISCSKIWGVVKHVLIIPLGLSKKACLGVKKEILVGRNWYKLQRIGEHNSMSSENQWRQKWSIFTSFIFRTDQFYFIDFQCSLSCVFLFFSCALFSIFFASLLCFILNCCCSEVKPLWHDFNSTRPFLLTWFFCSISYHFLCFLSNSFLKSLLLFFSVLQFVNQVFVWKMFF